MYVYTFFYESSEGSVESTQMCWQVLALTNFKWDKF